jgi:hypothetical protein
MGWFTAPVKTGLLTQSQRYADASPTTRRRGTNNGDVSPHSPLHHCANRTVSSTVEFKYDNRTHSNYFQFKGCGTQNKCLFSELFVVVQ